MVNVQVISTFGVRKKAIFIGLVYEKVQNKKIDPVQKNAVPIKTFKNLFLALHNVRRTRSASTADIQSHSKTLRFNETLAHEALQK